MARRRSKLYVAGKELPKKLQNIERCVPIPNAPDSNGKICVRSAKYGWSAWLVNAQGQNIAPLSISQHARSPGGAVRAAVQVFNRIRRGRR